MKNIGLVNGSLQQCPSSPNCVCSVDKDLAHHISPLSYDVNDPVDVQEIIRGIISDTDRFEIKTDIDKYIHAISTSLIFRFKDDVEFLFLDGRVEIRSASRLGHSDFGVNRQRVDSIREQFNAKLSLSKQQRSIR